jgi:hypothetical protein
MWCTFKTGIILIQLQQISDVGSLWIDSEPKTALKKDEWDPIGLIGTRYKTNREKAERLWLPQNALRRLHQCNNNPYHGFTK